MISYYKEANVHYLLFDYDLNIISYDNYQKMIIECQNWYNEQMQKINLQYEHLLNPNNLRESLLIGNEHKKVIIELIHKILTHYPIIQNMGIFISNSFARGSNLIDSDFDINYVYEKNNLIAKQIEEQISHALAIIVNKYRDFIHDSIAHRMAHNIVLDPSEKVIYKTRFGNINDEYEVTSGNEKLMLKSYYGLKDKESITNFFLSHVNSDRIDEWLYYQNIVYGEEYLKDVFEKIKLSEKQIVNEENSKIKFNNLIENTKNNYYKELESYNTINFTDMKNVKEYFKNKSYNKIFTLFALIKRRLLFDNIDITFNDILSYINNNLINFTKEDYEKILIYFGIIMRLNYVSDKYNIPFRTRFNNQIPLDFNGFYTECCPDINNDYITFHKNETDKLYKHLIKTMDKLKIGG